ncbi:MAG TPA: chaplin family protein [Streptosporangiaceae bacterium]
MTAGFVAVGSGAGFADVTHGDFGAGSGNQLHVPASAPLNVTGNAGSVLGQARAMSHSGASVHNAHHGMYSSGRFAVLGGNQGDVPLSAPINGSGNAATLLGQAGALSHSAAHVTNGGHRGGDRAMTRPQLTDVTRPVTNAAPKAAPQGAPVSAPQAAPQSTPNLASPVSSITDSTKALPVGQSLPVGQALPVGKLPLRKKHMAAAAGDEHGGGGMLTSGDFGVLSGNQAYAPVSAPVNACGNAISAFGQAFAACKGHADVHNSGDGSSGMYSSGRFGVLGGNQLNAPISAPVNFCGNSATLAGQAMGLCKGRATVHNGGRGHRVWTPRADGPSAPMPQADAPQAPPAPQQGPAPAPKPQLPKAHLPKLPISVSKPKPSACGCAPAPMASTPQVPSVGLPKPELPKVTPPKASAPQVSLPKPQMPTAKLPKVQGPKADVSLPVPQAGSGCGCAPQASAVKAPEIGKATGGDDNSVINHLAKKRDTVSTPAGDPTSQLTSNLLDNEQSPVHLTDTK